MAVESIDIMTEKFVSANGKEDSWWNAIDIFNKRDVQYSFIFIHQFIVFPHPLLNVPQTSCKFTCTVPLTIFEKSFIMISIYVMHFSVPMKEVILKLSTITIVISSSIFPVSASFVIQIHSNVFLSIMTLKITSTILLIVFIMAFIEFKTF